MKLSDKVDNHFFQRCDYRHYHNDMQHNHIIVK